MVRSVCDVSRLQNGDTMLTLVDQVKNLSKPLFCSWQALKEEVDCRR
jgi:hypothetical protein